jgi:hypothetical protein
MRVQLFACLTFACAAAALAAQTATTTKSPVKPLTLSGCVQASDASPNQFTFADDANATTTYRLSGKSMKKYAGKRVQIVGGVVAPRMTISGGLRPSPNVAGQAGAMDPTQAVIAGSSGGSASGIGIVDMPEFRVKSVKALDGTCPQ